MQTVKKLSITKQAGIPTDANQVSLDEARFADLVDTIDGIVWEASMDSSDFTFVNQYAELLLGYPEEDWYRPGFWSSILHPDDSEATFAYCRDCIEQQIYNYAVEYRVCAKDGRAVWLRDLVTVAIENGEPTHLRGIMIDISQQKKSEIELESSQAKFFTMFESAPIGILLVDAETDEIIEMNQAYCDLVGRSKEAVLSEGWQSYTHPDDLGEEMANVDQLCEGQVDNYQYQKRYIKPNGDVVTVQQKVAAIDPEHKRNDSQYLIIIEDISERQVFEQRIWHQANFDYLTDLPNRSMFQERVAQLITEVPRRKQSLAIMMIDLDGFKDVNDAYGHESGDKLLVSAGKRIESCIRKSDMLARLGGDEFVVVLNNLERSEGIEQVADKILRSLAKDFKLEGKKVHISASIGISSFPDDGNEVLELLKSADQAMYLAKRNGKNRYQFFTHDLQKSAEKRLSLTNDLRNAIVEQQFELHYQPIIDIANNEVFKAEALIRWNHASRGLVSPIDFIPLAEETRLISGIGDWVFRAAIEQRKEWQSIFKPDFQISVNASPIQFDDTFSDKIAGYLSKAGVDGNCIGIELTETLFMTSKDEVLKTLVDFRDAGIEISLDDFGTGYSSLSYLKKFDIDYLKIDRSFVMNLSEESDDLVLCQAIIMMAHQLGIKVIAEGIETEVQLDLLRSIDCDYGQGYYISRPIPAKQFEDNFAPK